MNRQISRVAFVSLVLLGALIVATTYWQTWAAGGLAARQDNAIKRVAQFKIKRGKIYAADGDGARDEHAQAGRTARRSTSAPTRARRLASQVVGYSTQARSRAGLERERERRT